MDTGTLFRLHGRNLLICAMHFTIQPALIENLPNIYSFELAYIREIEPEAETRWINAIPLHLQQWIESLPRTFIAADSNQVLGHAFWEASGDADHAAEVGSVYVSVAARRQGVGRALLERCEQEASAAGMKKMRLSVKRHNPAQELYKAMGYAFSGESVKYDVYEKTLAL